MGILITVFVIAYANNKVEGMALCKLFSILSLGFAVPYLAIDSLQWLYFLTPPFWITKYSITGSYNYLLTGSLLIVIWISIFWNTVQKRNFS